MLIFLFAATLIIKPSLQIKLFSSKRFRWSRKREVSWAEANDSPSSTTRRPKAVPSSASTPRPAGSDPKATSRSPSHAGRDTTQNNIRPIRTAQDLSDASHHQLMLDLRDFTRTEFQSQRPSGSLSLKMHGSRHKRLEKPRVSAQRTRTTRTRAPETPC